MKEILEVMNIVDVDIHIPGVTAVTSRRIEGDEKVFRPVTAVFCDTRVFAAFHAIKRRTDRLCLSNGTRLCGGFAVPDNPLDFVLEQIRIEQQKFEAEKANLLSCWPQPVEDWIAAHPKESAEIQAVAPKSRDLATGLSCDVRVFKVNPSASLDRLGIQDGLEKQISGISRQIANEIATEARNSWKSRQDKGASNQEIRKGLKRWADKLKSLAFLDPAFVKVEELIRNGINNLPTTGKIEGNDFLVLSGLMGMLTNPERLLVCELGIGAMTPELVVAPPPVVEHLIGW